MSVNIFGSSGKNQSAKRDNTYVDRKFINLATTLNTKVSKAGDTMNGNLNMGDNKITSSYVPVNDDDVINKKYLSTLSSASGTMSDVAVNTLLLSKVNKTGDTMSGDLNMGMNKVSSSHVPNLDSDLINKRHFDEKMADKLGQYNLEHIMNNLSLKVSQNRDGFLTGPLKAGIQKITSTYVPINPEDLVNKLYLDQRYYKNNIGHIPDINKNINHKTGFIVTANNEMTDAKGFKYHAWHAFSNGQSEWKVSDRANMYIQIQCPEAVRVYKFALRGRNSNTDRIINWRLEASNDGGSTWKILSLNSDRTIPLGNVVQFFSVNGSYKYPLANIYRLNVIDSESNNPGLSHFQLYTLIEPMGELVE